jgi:hypothetical protein
VSSSARFVVSIVRKIAISISNSDEFTYRSRGVHALVLLHEEQVRSARGYMILDV